MTGRPLTAIATLGMLVCAATVGLEAVGVLFPVPDQDPEQRMEAFLARLEADSDSMVAPSRPVDLPDEATAHEPVWLDTEPAAPAGPPGSAEGVAGQDPPTAAPAGEARMAALLAMTIPPTLAPEGVPEDKASPMERLSPPWQSPALTVMQEPEPVAVVPVVQAVEPAPAPPQRQRLARSDRVRTARANPGGAGSVGCPFLDWLTQ